MTGIEQTGEADRSAEEIVAWLVRRFPRSDVVVSTGFGMEGSVVIELLSRHWDRFDVYWLDTHVLFPETHATRAALAERFPGVQFVNAGTDLTTEAQARQFGPELWHTSPDLCCHLRKVQPMGKLLRGREVWVTGLRRESAPTRAGLRQVMWDWQFDLLKVSPLAAWSREDVRQHLAAHAIPSNPLHERGYPSIGCMPCTRPVDGTTGNDDTRAGRWDGRRTECGLHRGSRARDIPPHEEQVTR